MRVLPGSLSVAIALVILLPWMLLSGGCATRSVSPQGTVAVAGNVWRAALPEGSAILPGNAETGRALAQAGVNELRLASPAEVPGALYVRPGYVLMVCSPAWVEEVLGLIGTLADERAQRLTPTDTDQQGAVASR